MPNPDAKSCTASAVSRRRFMQSAALGAAGAGLFLGNPAPARAKIKGTITLDALMITYLGQVINSTQPVLWTFTPRYFSTYAFNAAADPALQLRPRTPDAKKVFLGSAYTQTESDGLARGIVLRNRNQLTLSIGSGSAPPLPPPAQTADDSAIEVILRPKLRIVGNPGNLRFHFVSSGASAAVRIGALRNGSDIADELAPETRESLLAQYILDPARLVEPRFELRLSMSLSAGGSLPVSLSQRFNRTFATPLTGRTSATIVEQEGIDIAGLAVGNRLNVTHAAVREVGGELLRYETTVSRAEMGVTEIYWDWLFKNFVAIDRGFVSPAQTFLHGRVTDGTGASVGGALVKIRRRGANEPIYATVADAEGYFAIAAAEGRPVQAGRYEAVSGNLRQSFILDGGGAMVNLAGVDAEAARRPLISDDGPEPL